MNPKNKMPRGKLTRARFDDLQRLTQLAEQRGWRIEMENADTLLRSPTGKHGDAATIRISSRNGKQSPQIWIETRRTGISRPFRGIWMAELVLREDEQWRFKNL